MADTSAQMINDAFEVRRDLYIRAGFAPGQYWCTCTDCEERFDGDKRASRCFTCASVLLDNPGVTMGDTQERALLERLRDLAEFYELRPSVPDFTTPLTQQISARECREIRGALLAGLAEISRLRSELEKARARLNRVEALACEPLIDGENANMLRLNTIRIELGLSVDDPRLSAANPAACAAPPRHADFVIVQTPKSEPNLEPSNVYPEMLASSPPVPEQKD